MASGYTLFFLLAASTASHSTSAAPVTDNQLAHPALELFETIHVFLRDVRKGIALDQVPLRLSVLKQKADSVLDNMANETFPKLHSLLRNISGQVDLMLAFSNEKGKMQTAATELVAVIKATARELEDVFKTAPHDHKTAMAFNRIRRQTVIIIKSGNCTVIIVSLKCASGVQADQQVSLQ